MKLKTDENLGNLQIDLLRAAGYDVATVPDQKLAGAEDGAVIEVCRNEHRCLVTLDLDFANPLLFRPEDYHGIAVIRPPHRPSAADLSECVETLIRGLARDPIEGKLWIIQKGRIRQYQPDN